MQSKSKRSRILVIGALIGSVLSIGVASGSASAWSRQSPTEITIVNELPTGRDIPPMSARSGIRW